MTKRIGRQTVAFSKPVVIRAAASTVGKKEGEGPLGQYFDEHGIKKLAPVDLSSL